MANQLELIPLETYEEKLNSFHPKNKDKIEKAVIERLSFNPKHGILLKGEQTISGVKLVGLRHFKVGIKGVKKGVFIEYRYCKECLENSYYLRSDVQCQFCDKDKPDRIVLFLVDLRSAGYK